MPNGHDDNSANSLILQQYPTSMSGSRGATVVRFSIIETQHSQGKAIGLTPDGKLSKMSPPGLTSGTYRTMVVRDENELAAVLASFPQDAVLVTGVSLAGHPDGARVTTKNRALPGELTRTRDALGWPDGPVIVGLDVDLNTNDASVLDRVRTAGGLRPAVLAAVPELARYAGVWAASGSSGIVNQRTGERYGINGLHLFLFCKAADGVDELVNIVHARLKVAGLGFAFVSKAGTTFSRSPLDTTASCNPTRLFYRAPAIFTNPDLGYENNVRTPIVQHGPWLDPSRDIPALDIDEMARLEETEAAILGSVSAKGKAVRAARHKRLGIRAPSEEIIRRYGRPHIPLPGDTPLHLDDGREISAVELLAEALLNPDRFRRSKVTLADPLEPGYGSGRNLAFVRISPAGHIDIFSHAHGGQIFEFRPSTDDVRQLISPH